MKMPPSLIESPVIPVSVAPPLPPEGAPVPDWIRVPWGAATDDPPAGALPGAGVAGEAEAAALGAAAADFGAAAAVFGAAAAALGAAVGAAAGAAAAGACVAGVASGAGAG